MLSSQATRLGQIAIGSICAVLLGIGSISTKIFFKSVSRYYPVDIIHTVNSTGSCSTFQR